MGWITWFEYKPFPDPLQASSTSPSRRTMAAAVASSPRSQQRSNVMVARRGERTTSEPIERALSCPGDTASRGCFGHGSASSQTSTERCVSEAAWEVRFTLAAECSFFGGEGSSTSSICSRDVTSTCPRRLAVTRAVTMASSAADVGVHARHM